MSDFSVRMTREEMLNISATPLAPVAGTLPEWWGLLGRLGGAGSDLDRLLLAPLGQHCPLHGVQVLQDANPRCTNRLSCFMWELIAVQDLSEV